MELISEYFVKPKHDVLAAKEPIYLTPLEICMLGIHPIQRGLLYNYTLHQSTSSIILNIIDDANTSCFGFTRARNLSTDQETACCMVINTRPRLDPKLSDNHFGNHISQVKVISKVDELLGHDYNWAAMRLNDGIESRDGNSILTGLNWIAQLLSTTGFSSLEGDIKGPNGVVIGGSARFDIYGLEFGLGKAVAVRMGPGNKTDGRITAHSGCQGNGSVDLEISLKEDHMASLEMDHEFMPFIS